ncbi:nicotinate-nucleotide adenylyltransferase NadD [Legionella wadsworthii]|uniref:Probable nicotinate-nucleotide adenylyltransferase n=1 Tax=Legionella wadsworthii TaxID=28088 RepID=A0A378LQ52_9GAMM|nr:nicotinate-nucleotide adenylyltransferase [Legionella wadsworthii]STY29066.1 nicotinate-nucleotide adenylyltransferase NadD [Legionella wadsworthii]
MHSIAIFGGSFDPIHNGHLQVSVSIQHHFNFDSYIFLPCKTSTIKPPTLANNGQRIEMIHLAIKDFPEFKMDLREIERPTPSYMVETLESFRAELPNDSISLIMGYDAFLSLTRWHQWEKIITLSNLIIINRSEFSHFPPSKTMEKFLKEHQVIKKWELLNSKAGKVFLFDAGNYEISSTSIREEIKKGADVRKQLPEKVYHYIKCQELYQ